ncbi:MAG: glucokinase [Sideroxydans sp.]
MILSGDIGGTKTRLALVETAGPRVLIRREAEFASVRYATFEDVLHDFLQTGPRILDAAFGIAGPVHDGVVQATNLPWRIEAPRLRERFGFVCCHLLNDLEATACGLPALGESDLVTLQAGAPGARGNQAVIAAGTGLGEAGLYWDGHRHRPFATEGGHASFSPRNALEFGLLQHLQAQYGHVSWERVVSGMALPELYRFLVRERGAKVPDWLVPELSGPQPAAAISAAALQRRDPLCEETLRWFVSLYGAEAGNLALKTLSLGGLYLGGGIAPKILPLLQQGEFMAALLDKGRMRPLLQAMPVKVILNDRAALYGPALFAAAHRGAI